MNIESQKTFSWLASLLVGFVALCFVFVMCIFVHSDKLKPTKDGNAPFVLLGFIATIGLFCMTVLVYRLLGYMYDFHLRAMHKETEGERKSTGEIEKANKIAIENGVASRFESVITNLLKSNQPELENSIKKAIEDKFKSLKYDELPPQIRVKLLVDLFPEIKKSYEEQPTQK